MRDPDLIHALEAMRIEEPGAIRSFEDALAEETGWPAERARQVSREYRRFLYLAATSERPLSPSVAVDRAWHLHLGYSRHYREKLCGEILKRPLDHRPSGGGAHESESHRRQYAETLALYEAEFGEPPPLSAWPRKRTVERRPKAPAAIPWVLGAALGLGAAFVGAALAGAAGVAIALVSGAALYATARAIGPQKPHDGKGDAACGSAGGSCGSCSGVSDAPGSCGGGGCGGD